MRKLIVAAALLGTACVAVAGTTAPTPDSINPDYAIGASRLSAASPEVANSMQHWQSMANYSAERFARSINDSGKPSTWAFRQSDFSSSFEQVYQRMLTAALIKQGVRLAMSPGDKTGVIDVKVDSVDFNPREYRPWTVSKMSAYLWVVKSMISIGAPALETFSAVTLLSDVLASTRDHEPNRELAITMTAAQSNEIVASQSDIFLVYDKDATLYAQRTLPIAGR